MTLESFQKWLDNYLNFEKTQTKNIFWLESMKFLAEKLGNPQDKIKCIHVAGSKGKGSCSSMIASIISRCGFKCGVYSSPHISDFRERITLNGAFFPDEIYEKSAEELTKTVDSIPLSELPASRPLTWFELVTLFSFLCYKNAGCDWVVYETGLGGRLDSTNIVKPLVTVLMAIELEHTEFLGDTIEKIAGEKAGIIKQNTPAVIALQNFKEAENVFEAKCREMNAESIFVKDKLSKLEYKYDENGKMAVSLTINNKVYSADLKLPGKVQAQNAAAAILAVKKVLPEISVTQINQGLSEATIPGRFEIHRNIILDGAHTVKSISNTIQTLKEIFPHKKYHLLFAIAGDKDINDIIPLFKNQFKTITFTEPETVRHCDSSKAFKIAESLKIPSILKKNLTEAFSTLRTKLKNDDILLVTGSFYLVSEVKKLFR